MMQSFFHALQFRVQLVNTLFEKFHITGHIPSQHLLLKFDCSLANLQLRVEILHVGHQLFDLLGGLALLLQYMIVTSLTPPTKQVSSLLHLLQLGHPQLRSRNSL